MIYSV